MTVGAGLVSFSSPRFKTLVLLAAPILVILGARLMAFAPGFDLHGPEALDRRIERLNAEFSSLMTEASRVAADALRTSPAQSWVRHRPGPLGTRIEGVGLLDGDLGFTEWEGTPVEPDGSFGEAGWPRWTVRVEGARTRLVVKAGPDEQGRLALASFVIDSAPENTGFERLLSAHLRRGVLLALQFRDSQVEDRGPAIDGGAADASRGVVEIGEHGRTVSLRSPSGEVLAVAGLAAVDPDRRVTLVLRTGRAWSVVVLVVLLALMFDWRVIGRSWAGLVAVIGVLGASRGMLAWQQVPARLLPRELGAPSLYGSSEFWGLVASPADLLLTAAAVYLLCAALRNVYGSSGERPRPARLLLVALGCTGATLAGIALTLSLARNSRIPLLERPAPFEWDGRLVLWAGLMLTLLGAAELWALLASAALRSRLPASNRSDRIQVAVVFLLLIVGSSTLLQRLSERTDVEQLRSEFAPQVLEQSSRRRVALSAAMREIQESYRLPDELARPQSQQLGFLAYRYWMAGELSHSRYKSSLDFYAPDGTLLSHFGFDLPPLDESVEGVEEPGLELTIEDEEFQGIAVARRLLHAEVPIIRGGQLLAVVVGHVLDEPDNLPFLPWSQPYLAALAPGSVRGAREAQAGGPHYVLYDEAGAVVLTTLRQPPAETPEILEAAASGETLGVVAGDEPYLGLALEHGDQVHLLLSPRRSSIERLAAAVRLCLLGMLLSGLLALGIQVSRPEGPRELVLLLRGSFYRKLLAALLLASILPLVGLALFLRGYIERRGDAALISSATQFVSAAQQVVEDYSAQALEAGDREAVLEDGLLYWLRRVVGQEIHVYAGGRLQASSKRELFASGLLPPRLEGRVQRKLVGEGLPSLVVPTTIGPSTIPVAYAPVRFAGEPSSELVVAVPLVLEQRQIARAISRVAEMILLATVALVGLLAVAAAILARTVARPLRELVGATSLIAAGKYSTRLQPRTRDEVAELVCGFNTMASALGRQRADLERRRDYIETLLRHATAGVISLDTDGRLVTLNPAATELLRNLDPPLEIGSTLVEALSGSEELRPLARALSSSRRSGEPVEVDLAREGQPRRLRLVRVDLHDASGGSFGTLLLLDDVTDLMRSNQLAAWAEMARAIAHEIKNPLTPIQLSTEHLQRLLHDRGVLPSPEVEACLETIIKQVRALYDIAGEFSAYAKLPVLDRQPTDPVALMRTAIGPYRASNPPGLSIEERYRDAPPVAVDRKVLSRAVVNLVENALQAMADGGTLTVAVTPDDDDGQVELSIADTGPGLSPEVRRRLFEPYFSTKSSGTGLGLAIVRRVVEAHEGTIEVESRPGRGTTFRIRLPQSTARVRPNPE